MANPHGRHPLPGCKRLPDAGNTVGHIVAQSIIFPGMNPYDKTWCTGCDFHKLPYDTLQLKNIVDFLADNVTACHIRISGNSP